LGAIESVLNEHERVTVAAVVLKKIHGEKRIVAYFQSDEQLEPASLKEHLRQRLPAFMTPYAIIQMEKVFLGNNGKIDRGRLEKLEVCMKSLSEKSLPPENELQRRMVEIWSDLLGVGQVGIDDDFLNLGGHSLLAITIIQRLNQELDVKLSIEDIYENLTIRELAALIEAPRTEERELTGMVEFAEKCDSAKPGSQSEKLFLVHGVGGNLATYYPLVRQIQQTLAQNKSRDINIYGLQANAVADRQLSSAREMVEAYVDHITSVQKSGPYLLGGWSYGASVAFLIAQELIKRGERIAGFLSIDAEAPQSFPDFAEFLNENNIESAQELYEDKYLLMAIRRFGCHFGFADNGGIKDKLNAFLGNTGAIRVKDKLHTFLGYPNASSISERDTRNMVAVTNLYNISGFDPKRIAVEKTLFIRATESKFDGYEQNWSEAIDSSQVMMEAVEGDHWSIMGEKETASHISQFLESINMSELNKESPANLHKDEVKRPPFKECLNNSPILVSKNAKKTAVFCCVLGLLIFAVTCLVMIFFGLL
jgi:thioesterase domain-containing protein/acyl carrier protein